MGFLFENKKFLVTGAAGGIGLSVVKELLKRKAVVIALDIETENLKKFAETEALKDQFFVEKFDVRKEKDWEKIFSTDLVQNLYGLIQAAGVIRPGYVYEVTHADVDYHFDINTKGTILGCIYAAKLFTRQKQGHIVNISSLAGISAIPGISLYSASKFAVRGYSLAIAQELLPYNVAVTVICPDAVATPMLDLQIHYPQAALTFSGSNPLSPEEVCNAIISAFETKPREISLPFFRSVLAKLAGVFPETADFLAEPLQKRGLKKQEKLKQAR